MLQNVLEMLSGFKIVSDLGVGAGARVFIAWKLGSGGLGGGYCEDVEWAAWPQILLGDAHRLLQTVNCRK